MSELTPAPELVEPGTESDTSSVPKPDDGQQVETPSEPPAPESYHIGDVDYSMEQLAEHIERSDNIVSMQRSAHDSNKAANEKLEKALAIQNDEELQELRTILNAIKRDGGMNPQWDALRRQTFAEGAPQNPLAMAARMEQLESKLGTLSQEKGEMVADDVLGQFAAKHEGMTKEQAVEIGAKFLAETKAEHFPDGSVLLDQLEYFHWKNYGQQGQADALETATKTGYDDALAKVKAGHGAELGSPATTSEAPWTPPADADERPMLASELAALADDSIVFPEDGDILS